MAKNFTFQVPPNPTGVYSIPVGVGGGGGTNMGDLNIRPPHMIHDNIVEHFIEGKTIAVEFKVGGNEAIENWSSEEHGKQQIKETLVEMLAKELHKSNMIEFTQMKKCDTDEMIFRARIHVTPDTQVRIIRELKDAKRTT